jgi:hypothetical protein
MAGGRNTMRPGAEIDVRNRFEGRWATGFVVASVSDRDGRERVAVRRKSDGVVLPVEFEVSEVRSSGPGPATR